MMKRLMIALACSAVFASCVMAQDRPEVRAAEESARQQLRNEVLALSVAPGLNMRAIVDRAPEVVGVDEIVQGARRIGPPRWVEADLVQVKLQVPASAVLNRLTSGPAETRDPRLTPSVLKRLERDWANRQVQASGQAIPADRIVPSVIASSAPEWAGMAESARVDAARRAQAAAVRNIVRAGSQIRVGTNQSLQDYLGVDAQQSIAAWARQLPATRVVLRDDRNVEVGLYLDKPGFAETLRALAVPDGTAISPNVAEAIDAGVRPLPQVFVGRAAVMDEPVTTARPLFETPPAWAGRLLTAEATAAGGGDKLRTARRAEAAARESLRSAIDALPADRTRTLGQAAAAAPAVNQTIDRAIRRARTYQVDYHADGSVTLRLSLDSSELVDALSR